MDHKRQHWIPQGYLKAWCDADAPAEHEPYVWQFVADGSASRKKAPRKIFFESELYTVNPGDGARDLGVEHALAELESCFVRIRDHKLSQNDPLTDEEHVQVRAFMAAMQGRTPFQIDHWRSNWEAVASLGRRMQADMDAGHRISPSIPGHGPTMSLEDVEALADAQRGMWVFPMIESQLPILCEMNLSMLHSEDPIGFITSDSPCVWFDPEDYKMPPHMRGPSLASETVEVTLPCSPSQLLVLSWRLPAGRIPIPQRLVNDLNRRTRFHAKEHFVVCTNQTRPEWFEVRQPPPEDPEET